MKSTNPPYLTHMDFANILSGQCTHQEMKILKILSSYHERFQNYDCLNCGLFSLDSKPLQFMLFWDCSYSASLIQPVNIWNFEWGLIFWKYLLQKTFLVEILKITPVLECYNCQINHFNIYIYIYIFFFIFSGLNVAIVYDKDT